VHASARQRLGAIKQTKNRARLLLATSQCRLALKAPRCSAYVLLSFAAGPVTRPPSMPAAVPILPPRSAPPHATTAASSATVVEDIRKLVYTGRKCSRMLCRCIVREAGERRKEIRSWLFHLCFHIVQQALNAVFFILWPKDGQAFCCLFRRGRVCVPATTKLVVLL